MTSLSGVFPIVPTPFSDDGALDIESLRRVIGYLVDAGVHGLAVLGVASEVYALTDAERMTIVETAAEPDEDESEDSPTAMRYRAQRRAGKGLRDIKTSERNGKVIADVAAT